MEFVGQHCIINSRSLIEHDVQIGDHCHISTGVLLNGEVTVGSAVYRQWCHDREGLILPPQAVIGAGKRVMGWPEGS